MRCLLTAYKPWTRLPRNFVCNIGSLCKAEHSLLILLLNKTLLNISKIPWRREHLNLITQIQGNTELSGYWKRFILKTCIFSLWKRDYHVSLPLAKIGFHSAPGCNTDVQKIKACPKARFYFTPINSFKNEYSPMDLNLLYRWSISCSSERSINSFNDW